jgi:hypothetical protein
MADLMGKGGNPHEVSEQVQKMLAEYDTVRDTGPPDF